MTITRTTIAYLLAVAVTYVLATSFYTQQVIAKMAAIGAEYTSAQQIETYAQNFTGLWQFGAAIAIALLAAFVIASYFKRILKPLAPVAYPAAAAAAMPAMLILIEGAVGSGLMGGARDAAGLSLQALAGFIGGGVFAFARPR
jgi:hypothetical protein